MKKFYLHHAGSQHNTVLLKISKFSDLHVELLFKLLVGVGVEGVEACEKKEKDGKGKKKRYHLKQKQFLSGLGVFRGKLGARRNWFYLWH